MIKFVLLCAFAAVVLCQCPDWSYSGNNGPEFWGSLCDEYALCDSGTTQSPVDLRTDGSGASSSSFTVDVQYEDEDDVTFLNNGHTVEVELHPETEHDQLFYNGDAYNLAQFHFHTPSENTLDGNHYDMEVHFVHIDGDSNLLVLGVLIDADDDEQECDFLEQLENSIPQNEDDETEVDIEHMIDFDDDTDFFTFMGSLTTPPCSEGVRWVVRREPIVCGASQVAAFSSVLGNSNRPVQPLNSRSVVVNFAVESDDDDESVSVSTNSVSVSSNDDDDSSSTGNDDDDNSSSNSSGSSSNSGSSSTGNNDDDDSSSSSASTVIFSCLFMFVMLLI